MTHILVVDDEGDVLDSIGEVLRDAGFTVTLTQFGEKALTLLEQSQPDLIVLDIIMPDMNGIEVCKRIRENPVLDRIPIIFLTAKGRPDDMVSGYDAGANDYLVKPFDVLELPERIGKLLS
jgi:DNA-binding response OmpR family regulator